MSTIVELRSTNVKRLNAVSITPPSKGAVVIGGRNGQGKSSLLDSILFALAGKSVLPEQPVRIGAEQADISITISTTPPLIVTRKIKPDGKSTLEIRQKSSEGIASKVTSPQKVLDSLVGTVAFDPLAFTRMKPQDQVETLKRLVGVNTIDIDSDLEELTEKRKERKRDLASFEAMTNQMPRHADLPDNAQPLDATTLQQELQVAQDNNKSIQDWDDDIEEKKGSVDRWKSRIEQLQQELKDAEQRHQECVDDLQTSISAREKLAVIDLQPILEKSAQMGEHNRKVSENKVYRDRLMAQALQQKEIDDLTTKIDDLRQSRIDLMTEAKWPVPGLGFDAGGVTFNSLPFTQCSSAEQLRISTAIGMAQNPQLKLMLIRDGSLLDEDNLAFLHQMAVENEAQVFIERVSKGDECFLIIEDGNVLVSGSSETSKSLDPVEAA